MKYFEFLKRLLMFKKYPLFRTVPFRYLLLNILLVSILISLPYISSMFSTANTFGELDEIQNEVPDFTIENGQYKGEDKIINLNGDSVLFTEQLSQDNVEEINDDVLLGFLSDGLYISDFQNGTFSYSLIGDVNDKESLESFITTQMSSLYFYIIMYVTIYVIVIYFFVFTIMLILSFILSGLAKVGNKKTDYMNWFKIGSYAILIPALIIGIIQTSTGLFLWQIFILALIPFVYYYKKLPVKNKTQS
ncbi:DUF1189 domain-containing protein [Jeotgalicoccus huakuii]|nr:DUF1189 domain-containing protein [Jeotgalicoccus huakuii]